MEKKPLTINLLGGPGVGKSTLAAEIFVELKKRHIKCEYITEYAKDKTWEEAKTTLRNQIYVFGKQQHKMFRVSNKVDVMVCDSPLLFSIIYGEVEKGTNFYNLILEEHNKFNNINFYIKRKTKYDPIGRNQTEEIAKEIDKQILDILIDNDIPYFEYELNNLNSILEKIIEKL
jgi:nicotinamide riboside kinase